MNQIAKIENNQSEFQLMVEALHDNPIKDNTRSQNLNAIYKAFVYSISLTGAKTAEDKGASKFIVENFYDIIIVKHPYATLKEIEVAFKKGALKEYGEYFGWNVQTVWGFWKSYFNSQERKDAIIEKNKKLTENLLTSDKPMVEFGIESVKKVFEEYKSGEPLPAYSRVYYQALLKHYNKKTLIDDEVERKRIIDAAIQEYEASLKSKKVHTKQPEMFKMLMTTVLDKISPNRGYESVATKLALKSYFDTLIKEGKNVE
jgi:hypothetical protein